MIPKISSINTYYSFKILLNIVNSHIYKKENTNYYFIKFSKFRSYYKLFKIYYKNFYFNSDSIFVRCDYANVNYYNFLVIIK